MNIYEPTEQQLTDWQEWLDGRPPVVREIAEKLVPWKLYLLKTTNHRVTIVSYSEDGTVTVAVTGQYNFVTFPRKVFGINPADLEECDLPKEDEMLGEIISDRAEIEMYLAAKRGHGT